jgi:crotonobetainyl-CoA:carnitine CoA-transferase CaiB-like acyl-CoA transferase
MHRLFKWIYEEGLCDSATRDFDWIDYAMLVFTGQRPRSEYDHIVNTISAFTAGKTKAELFEGALKRQLLIAPVATASDILNMPRMVERGVWDHLVTPVGQIRIPGRFAIFSATPLSKFGPPPQLGEHTRNILSQPSRVPQTGDRRVPSSAPPLQGLKVLDFAWIMPGPLVTRVLADYSATVVRVESSERRDLVRSPNAADWRRYFAGALTALAEPQCRQVQRDP